MSGFEVHSASPERADAAGGSYVGVDTVVFLLEDSNAWKMMLIVCAYKKRRRPGAVAL